MVSKRSAGRGRWTTGLLAITILLTSAALEAQERLRKSLADDQVAAHWIYDDFPRAVEQAKATGKPILALLRCVP